MSFLIAKKLDNAAVTLISRLQTPLRAFPPLLTRLETPLCAFPPSPHTFLRLPTLPDTCVSKVFSEHQLSFLIAKQLNNATVTLISCLQTPLRAFPPSLTRISTPFCAFPPLPHTFLRLPTLTPHLFAPSHPHPTPLCAFPPPPHTFLRLPTLPDTFLVSKVFSERQLSFLIAKLRETFKGTPEEAVGKYTTGVREFTCVWECGEV